MPTATILLGVFGAISLVLIVSGLAAKTRGRGTSSDSGYIPGVTDGTIGSDGHHHSHGHGHPGDGGSHSGGHFDGGGHGGFSDGGGGGAHSAH